MARARFPKSRGELEAQRDQLDQQVRELLSAHGVHRAERAHGRTANLDWADQELDAAADKVRKERGE